MRRVFQLKQRLGRKFEEEVQFFRGWKKVKRRVGALMPTSAHAARRMASVINAASRMPVLELDAGTGVITKAILGRGIKPKQLVSVEYSRNFYQRLQSK
ncbi:MULTISPECIES: rRNA adenine N-6-methyltransferase family protein [Mesorhizobium]|uniref:rRNA adenine N-6-methyltransferase family protein n=1 Tax=Mesorhizobium TaxID=68287 RepID=UPI000AF8CC77|nr:MULTISPECIES: rRNA adenine N-6-methyltransferase family protein [Mesorhizobium]